MSKQGFRLTKAIKRIRKMKKRVRVVLGGTSAGKTYGIIPTLIDDAVKTPLLEISIVAETMPQLKKGALKDFIKIMKQTGRWHRPHWHATDKVYTFSNGSYIEFFSVDNEEKVRGPRRNKLYVNEANGTRWETYYQLAIRTDEEIYIDYNPTHKFWADTELLGRDNVEKLVLTYKDNNALKQSIINELESNLKLAFFDPKGDYESEENVKNNYWANWCRVYLLGMQGNLEGTIFDNWKIIDDVPKEARLLGNGKDFGFTNDPTTLVTLYMYEGKLLWDEVYYKKGMQNSDMARLIKQENVKGKIYADQSNPKDIKDLKNNYGINIEGAEKGQGSVNFGIGLLQEYEMLVTKRSTNIIEELKSYKWRPKKGTEGNSNTPIDMFNHAMDAMRYVAIMVLTAKKKHIKMRRTRR